MTSINSFIQVYKNWKLSIPLNVDKKVPGFMEDEAGDDEISHFVALHLKTYAFYKKKKWRRHYR